MTTTFSVSDKDTSYDNWFRFIFYVLFSWFLISAWFSPTFLSTFESQSLFLSLEHYFVSRSVFTAAPVMWDGSSVQESQNILTGQWVEKVLYGYPQPFTNQKKKLPIR